MSEPQRILRLREGQVAWREVEHEIIGVALERGQYFSVSPSGALLWSALAEGTTRETLVDRLAARFALEPERAGRDVDAFLAGLDEWSLLEP